MHIFQDEFIFKLCISNKNVQAYFVCTIIVCKMSKYDNCTIIYELSSVHHIMSLEAVVGGEKSLRLDTLLWSRKKVRMMFLKVDAAGNSHF